MGKIKEIDIHKPIPSVDDEDEQTLAAIDEGIGDVDAARSVPAKEVRKLPWITKSSTRKDR